MCQCKVVCTKFVYHLCERISYVFFFYSLYEEKKDAIDVLRTIHYETWCVHHLYCFYSYIYLM